jgi:alpha-ribazole phosphatase
MIILMRHGETEHTDGFYGRTDSQLTELGFSSMVAQARLLAFDAILTSPLQRCAKVAETLALQRHCPIYFHADWQEYDFGDWEARSIAQLWQDHPQALAQLWQDPTSFTPPNAEHFMAFLARVKQARDFALSLQTQHPHLLIITHAGVIRALRLLSQQNRVNDWLTYAVPHASLHHLSPHNHQVQASCVPMPAY